jgi:hypothetical protein
MGIAVSDEDIEGRLRAENARLRKRISELQAALDDECAAHKVCVEMRDAALAAINIHKGGET